MSSSRNATFWDRNARKYAAHKIKDPAGYERTLDRVRQYLTSGDTVLEIGCGTGSTALRLAPHVSRYIGTDISGGMIAIAREKAARDRIKVEFAVATPDRMPWPDGSFDALLAFNVLHLVPDRSALYAQARALLKPGGLFISKTPCLGEMNRLIRLAVPVMQTIGKAPHVDFLTGPALEQEIQEAGFAIVERARHGSSPRKDARIFIIARN